MSDETGAPRPDTTPPGSTLFGEMRRMARTSGAVGGIAVRVAGARVFGIKSDRAAHAGDLRAILGGLKGPLMKVAQFLSTVPDALPAEYAQELAELQANAPPMGWAFVRRRMQSELGPNWQQDFAEFGQTAEGRAAEQLGEDLEHGSGKGQQNRQVKSDAEHDQIDKTQPGIFVLNILFQVFFI